MRKITNLIFIFLISFICITEVYAGNSNQFCLKDDVLFKAYGSKDEFENKNTGIYAVKNDGNAITYNDVLKNPSSSPYLFHTYEFSGKVSGSDVVFSSFCRNPGITSGYTKSSEYCITEEILLGKSSNEITPAKQAYNSGISEILELGKKSSETDEDVKYLITNMAIRLYEMAWKKINSNSHSTKLYEVHKAYFTKMGSIPEVYTAIDDVAEKYSGEIIQSIDGGKYGFTYDNKYYIDGWGKEGVTDTAKFTQKIDDGVKELLVAGFKAAYNAENNATISWTKTSESAVTEGTHISKQIFYNLDLKNFKSDEAYVKLNLSCPDCASKGVEYSINVKKNEYVSQSITNYTVGSENTTGTNLLSYVDEGTGNVKLEVLFSAEDCEKVSFELKIAYKDETIDTQAYSLRSKGCDTGSSCQEFYLLTQTDVPISDTISKNDNLELCRSDCPSLQQACEKCVNDSCFACQQFEEKFDSKCPCTSTAIINNDDCVNGANANIELKEGYNQGTACTAGTDDSAIPQEEDVLGCIINNKDAAGNSYKAEEFEKVKENEFCSVWCKEDYQFTLPGIQEVNSGRYFSLKASIKGTKTCYTSEIDKDNTFETKLEEARKKVIDAYNEYQKWKAAAATSYTTDSGSDTASGGCCTSCCNPPEGSTCSPSHCTGGDTTNWRWYKKEWSYTVVDYSGHTHAINGQTAKTVNGKTYNGYYYDGGVTSCGCCSCQADNIGQKANPTHETLRDTAKSQLNSAISAYAKLINDYNACYGKNTYKADLATLAQTPEEGWKMGYDYNPEMSFWYEETYMNNVRTNKFDAVGSINKTNIEEIHYSSDNGKVPKDEISQKFASKKYFVCYKSGSGYSCGDMSFNIGKAKYVSQQLKADSKYITPTQFYSIYPSGAIIQAQPGLEDSIKNSDELTNGLPVGLGTKQGVYNYTISVSNLGEYYDVDKLTSLGRIWGKEDSVVVKTLESNQVCQEGTEGDLFKNVDVSGNNLVNGVYLCSYMVNVKCEDDCPLECEPEGCSHEQCDEHDCPFECEECIYNNKININYRPITNDNLNPNNKDLGINWEFDENNISTGLELKAAVTTKEIEFNGDKIYEIDFDADNSDLAVKVTLTGDMISTIRNYNDVNKDNGGYLNDSLTCYDYNQGDKTYKNIFCYSELLDELAHSDNIKFSIARPEGEENRKKYSANSYWKPITTINEETINKYELEISTTYTLDYFKNNYGTDINIGPAWK